MLLVTKNVTSKNKKRKSSHIIIETGMIKLKIINLDEQPVWTFIGEQQTQ